MGYIDMHCDTLMMYEEPSEKNSLLKNDLRVDFNKLKEGRALAQFFAMFMIPDDEKKEPISDEEYIRRLYSGFIKEVKENKDIIAFAKSYEDYVENKKNGIISAFLTIEDGRPVDGSFDNIQRYYELGVRLISLTWNFENCFGFPNSLDKEIMKKGLKPFGIEAVEVMNELGIIVDVSHLSDGGFWDVVKYSKKPFVASHSNCRALSMHQRNLTDDMIKALANAGGVSGINFAPGFLNSERDNHISSINKIVEHIIHFIKIGGIECVGIGSDFDGIDGELEVTNASKMPLIFDALAKEGFKASEIDKVAYGNVERIIKDNL